MPSRGLSVIEAGITRVSRVGGLEHPAGGVLKQVQAYFARRLVANATTGGACRHEKVRKQDVYAEPDDSIGCHPMPADARSYNVALFE
jgi:hypothetical protein